MWKCNDCGNVFDEADIGSIEELVGEAYGSPAYETWSCCPYCESTEIYTYDEDEDEYVMSGGDEDE